MKNRFWLLWMLLLTGILITCSPPTTETTVVSRIVKTADGKAYLEVDGRPLLYNAVQAWKAPAREYLMEDYTHNMYKAAETGYRIFTFWLYWRDLEPERGTYDWSSLDAMIDRACELDMRLDIVWGGSNFCAHLDPRFAPDWLLDWDEVHLKDENGEPFPCNGWDFGICPGIDHTNQEILEVEKDMLRRMIEHLEKYDKKHRVVFFQVLNETNIREWTYQGKEIVLEYANELASVLKEADYKIATRMNLSGPRIEPAIEELENIDCYGPDPYTDDIEVIRKLINTPTKMPHIAENAAYRNTTSLMITSFANGGYYNVYMLGPNLVWSAPGIYDLNWEPWEVTFGVFNLNTALNKIGSLVSVSLKSQMVEFNTEESYPLANYDREKELAGRAIAMKTWGVGETRNGAVGMAVHRDGYVYLIADRMAWFRFQEEPLHVSAGHLDESGNWVESHRKYWTPEPEGFEIPYHDGECLRVNWPD